MQLIGGIVVEHRSRQIKAHRSDRRPETQTETGGVIITPLPTPGRIEMGRKMALGEATPEEAADYIQYWNERAIFVFENQDMDGFFTVTIYND